MPSPPPRRPTPAPRAALVACAALAPVLLAFAGCGGSTGHGAAAGDRLDLADLVAVAEVEGQPWRLDLGTPGARANLIRGWSYDQPVEPGEEPSVWSLGRQAVLEFSVVAPTDFTLVLEAATFHLPGAPPQRVRARIGEHPLGSFVLDPTMRDHALTVPAAALRPGPNHLVLDLAYSVVPAKHGISRDHRELGGHFQGVRFVGLGAAGTVRAAGDDAGRLVVPRQRAAVWYLDPPPESVLEIAGVEAVGHGGELEVELTPPGAAPERHRFSAGEGPIRLPLPARGGPLRIALGAVGGRATLLPRDEPPTASEPPEVGVAVIAPRLVSPEAGEPAAAPPAVATASSSTRSSSSRSAASPARAGAPERLPDIVIYLVDTLRADHLGLYGYPLPTSPQLERFATDAITFLDAQAQTSWTRPAVASLLTGLVPQAHGVTGRLDALPTAIETLPERLQAVGYQTAGFITNGNVAAEFAMDQGFETYKRYPELRERPGMHVPARNMGRKALRWIDRQRDPERPLFLYLHATDPHAPYMPLEPWRGRFAAAVDPALGAVDFVQGLNQGGATPADLERDLVALYDAEVAQNDDAFGELVDGLSARGLYRDAVVVFVADHGEELADHGGWEHGITLYAEQLGVPLVIKLPGGVGGGRRIGEMVQQVDLVPTLLQLLGLPVPAGLDGRSLLPLVAGGDEEAAGWDERLAHAHLAVDRHTVEAVTSARWKLIEDRGHYGGPPRLYDRRADPGERFDVAAEEGFVAGLFRQHLRTLRYALRERSTRAREVEVGGELEDNLRALGYLQ